MSEAFLIADDLVKTFAISGGTRARTRVRAVDGVSLQVARGRTLAIVGESGSGKSTLGDLVLGLQAPDSGCITLDGSDTRQFTRDQWRTFRRRVQVVFQDPYASLDPRERIGDALTRPILLHRLDDRRGALQRACSLLERVGLSAQHIHRRPHQFSGGQRQRIAIARALTVQPNLIICDEPVSALDVSVQAQVVNLLQDLQYDMGVAFIFISHDLAVVRHLAHDVAVMYAGRFVETAATDSLFATPRHPYTRALFAAAPSVERRKVHAAPIAGEPPDLTASYAGCRFATRCPHVQSICRSEVPPLVALPGGHASACHFAEDLPPFQIVPARPGVDMTTLRLAAYRQARDRMQANVSS